MIVNFAISSKLTNVEQGLYANLGHLIWNDSTVQQNEGFGWWHVLDQTFFRRGGGRVLDVMVMRNGSP